MLGLMKRDLLVQRKRLWVMAVYCLLGPILFRSMGQAALVVVMVAVAYMMLLTAFAYDDKYKVDGTFASLPIKRESLVVARYLEIPVLSVTALLLYMLVTGLISPWIPGMFPTEVLLPVAAFLVVSLMSGLYLPIIYRYGYVKARIFNMVIFLAFALIPTAGLILGNAGGEITPPSWIANVSEGTAAAVLFAAAIVILFVSCLISIRMYEKRQF